MLVSETHHLRQAHSRRAGQKRFPLTSFTENRVRKVPFSQGTTVRHCFPISSAIGPRHTCNLFIRDMLQGFPCIVSSLGRKPAVGKSDMRATAFDVLCEHRQRLATYMPRMGFTIGMIPLPWTRPHARDNWRLLVRQVEGRLPQGQGEHDSGRSFESLPSYRKGHWPPPSKQRDLQFQLYGSLRQHCCYSAQPPSHCERPARYPTPVLRDTGRFGAARLMAYSSHCGTSSGRRRPGTWRALGRHAWDFWHHLALDFVLLFCCRCSHVPRPASHARSSIGA